MSPTLKEGIIAALVALVVALGVSSLFHGGGKSATYGGTTTQTGLATQAPANATSFVGPYGVESDAGFFDATGAVSQLIGTLDVAILNIGTASGFIAKIPSVGTCYAGSYSASSTAAIIVNPSTSTSTATLISITGVGNATSTQLEVGTTTLGALGGVASANFSTAFASTTVASSSQYYLAPGTPGMTPAGGGNFRTIQVAPKEAIYIYATSTGAIGMSVAYSPSTAFCTYKIEWNN